MLPHGICPLDVVSSRKVGITHGTDEEEEVLAGTVQVD